jgi:hypothetical protein
MSRSSQANDEAKNLAASNKMRRSFASLRMIVSDYRPFFTRKVMRSLTRLE